MTGTTSWILARLPKKEKTRATIKFSRCKDGRVNPEFLHISRNLPHCPRSWPRHQDGCVPGHNIPHSSQLRSSKRRHYRKVRRHCLRSPKEQRTSTKPAQLFPIAPSFPIISESLCGPLRGDEQRKRIEIKLSACSLLEQLLNLFNKNKILSTNFS